MRGQHGFNFPQLDPKTANLDLVVGAAQALHAAVGVNARQVAGAVQAGVVRAHAPGVGNKFFSRQFRPAQITCRHPRPGDAQLTDLATRQQHQAVRRVGVDHQQPVIGQRPANGHHLARVQFGQTGRHRGLGWPVGVEHAPARPRPARHQRLGAHLSAQVDQPQPRHVLRKQRQQRGHRMQHGDLVGDQRQRQRFRVRGHFFRSQPQRGAGQVADPDFFERHVKRHRKALVNPVGIGDLQLRIFTAQKVANAALADFNALGLAGRAGRVNHIGRV